MSGYQQTTTYNQMTKVEAVDETIPYRLVGTYEYKNALEAFDKLLKMSSKKDLESYGRMIKERPEFTFFNGANLGAGGKKDLKAASIRERKQFDDEFRKKGLAWMIALAKIELCSTESLYGKSKKPFESLPVTKFDAKEFLSILADDAAAHLKSLASEPGFKEVVRRARSIDFLTISYLRRLKLVRDMLTTLESVGTGPVKQKVKAYDEELGKYEQQLYESVDQQTGFSSTSVTRQGQQTSRRIGQCSDLVAEEQVGGSSTGGGGGRGAR